MLQEPEALKNPAKPHKISIENRQRAVVTGVEDVDSFNENEIIFLTGAGMMTILGKDLHINKLNLDDGQLIIDGTIECADYADHDEIRKKKGTFKR